MTGYEWGAAGLMLTVMLALFGYIWQTNLRIGKVENRLGKAETMLEPLWEIAKAALPKVLKLHNSPDMLWQVLNCDATEEEIQSVDERLKQVIEEASETDDSGRVLAAVVARWMVDLRRKKLK